MADATVIVNSALLIEMPMKFRMPMGGNLEVHPSSPIDEDVGLEEKIDGVVYTIIWDGVRLPWCTHTRAEAYSIAMGCQWGAMEQFKKDVR